MNYALTSKLDEISVFSMTIFPGSKLYDIARNYGSVNNDWTKMNLLTPTFIPNNLRKEQLNEFSRLLIRKFYLRPRIIIGFIKRLLLAPKTWKHYYIGLLCFFRLTK